MPVKQIPDLNWEKENTEKEKTEQSARKEIENRTGPTLRSSKRKQTINKIKKQKEADPNKTKKKSVQIFFQ